MKKINEKLCVGDKIKLWQMAGESGMKPGLKGVVKKVTPVMDNIHYEIKWENGRTLDLLSDVDMWILEERENENCNSGEKKSDNISEASLESFKKDREFINKNKDILNEFDTNKLLDFLEALRKCGWVNMLQSAVYLYAGKENIKKMHPFQDETELCEEMLELADQAKNEMIQGTISYMENQGREITIENVNSQIKRLSSTILRWYINRKK